MSKTDKKAPATDAAPAEDMTAEERAQVGQHVSYKTTLVYGENSRFTFDTFLPEETVEVFCHGVMREGIELPGTPPGIRRFVRPREIILQEVTE